MTRNGGLFRFEDGLARAGFTAVAGVDEAGRGACAGPLVVASVVFGSTVRREGIAELRDSKLLTAAARERVMPAILAAARSWSMVIIEPTEIDQVGLHKTNIAGMRRALARLSIEPDYVLSDGFPVPGTKAPNLGIWKGDQVCACVAAAGVIAKVTRDAIMTDLDQQWPEYGFAAHKGYVTAGHRRALLKYGATPAHRFSFEPVRRVASRSPACAGTLRPAMIGARQTELGNLRRVPHER